MNTNRRTQASARRRAEAELIDQHVKETDPSKPKPLIDSKTTGAMPCPVDPPEAEETLP